MSYKETSFTCYIIESLREMYMVMHALRERSIMLSRGTIKKFIANQDLETSINTLYF